MALTELLFGIEKAYIGSVTLDASIREVHRAKATVTRHPVETEEGGPSTASDHVRVDPLSIQIEGMITNTPAEFLAGVVTAIGGGSLDPAKDAHLRLLTDMFAGQIVTVFTTLLTYENMVLESVEVTRDAQKGNALYFTAAATNIRIVELEEAELAAARPTGQSTKNTGKGQAKPAGEATATQSSALFQALF